MGLSLPWPVIRFVISTAGNWKSSNISLMQQRFIPTLHTSKRAQEGQSGGSLDCGSSTVWTTKLFH